MFGHHIAHTTRRHMGNGYQHRDKELLRKRRKKVKEPLKYCGHAMSFGSHENTKPVRDQVIMRSKHAVLSIRLFKSETTGDKS